MNRRHTTEVFAKFSFESCMYFSKPLASAATLSDVMGPESQGGMWARNGKRLMMDLSGVSKPPARKRERSAATITGSSTYFTWYPYIIDTAKDIDNLLTVNIMRSSSHTISDRERHTSYYARQSCRDSPITRKESCGPFRAWWADNSLRIRSWNVAGIFCDTNANSFHMASAQPSLSNLFWYTK